MGKAFLTKLKSLSGTGWLIAAAAVGLILFLVGGVLTPQEKISGQLSGDGEQEGVRFYTEELERRIEELCLQIHGIREAHVLLTLEGGSEYIYSTNLSGTHTGLFSGGRDADSPVLLQEICPKIRGVAVVCTRGSDSSVQLTVTELLSAALGISTANICVAGT